MIKYTIVFILLVSSTWPCASQCDSLLQVGGFPKLPSGSEFELIQIEGAALADTIVFTQLIKKLICDENLDEAEHEMLMDSFYSMHYNFMKVSKNYALKRFAQKKWRAIESIKEKVLLNGYQMAIKSNDHLRASKYSKLLAKLVSDYKLRRKWLKLDLEHFETYAYGQPKKLISYHTEMLMKDTSLINSRTEIYNQTFKGYDHLVNELSKFYTKRKITNLLEASLKKSSIEIRNEGDYDYYYLQFHFLDSEFNFLDEEISKYYMKDTILIDTVTVWDLDSTDEIEIVHDTIKQQIFKLEETKAYKSKLRKSFLFNIPKRMH